MIQCLPVSLLSEGQEETNEMKASAKDGFITALLISAVSLPLPLPFNHPRFPRLFCNEVTHRRVQADLRQMRDEGSNRITGRGEKKVSKTTARGEEKKRGCQEVKGWGIREEAEMEAEM